MLPFSEASQLHTGTECQANELPGFPGLKLNDKISLQEHLQADLCSEDLDRLSSKLWMLSDMSSANVSALHRQKVKGRTITITEDPKLHLVWTEERVFIKPVPIYLLSWSFWKHVFDSQAPPLGKSTDRLRRWSLGYLRTYTYLIRHESDFRIAKAEGLLPADESLTWAKFRAFSKEASSISDAQVCNRFMYSELRLTRLNFYSRLFIGKPFERVHRTYGAYFAQFYGPLAFVFAVLSLALSAMQVETGAVSLLGSDPWGPGFSWLSLWFGVAVFLVVVFISFGLVCNLAFKLWKEWGNALRKRFSNNGSKRQSAA